MFHSTQLGMAMLRSLLWSRPSTNSIAASERWEWLAAFCAIVVGWTLAATAVGASDAPHARDFNGPDPVWQPIDNGVAMRVLSHECMADGARDKAGCEHIVLAAPAGQSVHFACDTATVAVLDELEVRMWVKSTRLGVQLAARVTLPRSRDPKTQSPVTVVVRGHEYIRVGQWQQLVLAEVPKRLAEQVRVLRTVPGATIDPREAFVDAIVLVVPSGREGTEVWTDELAVDGVAVERDGAVEQTVFAAPAPAHLNMPPSTVPPVVDGLSQSSSIRLQGSTLLVEGRPFLPRAIQWRGEPLQFLSERGFNTVQLPALPTVELSTDARRHGLWFLCPPPPPDVVVRSGLGRGNDRILGWYLTDDSDGTDPESIRRWSDLVRRHDPVTGRPVVVVAEADWTSASRAADIIAAHHLFTGRMTEDRFRGWLESRPVVTNPGTPLWLHVPTQFGASVGEQCAALAGKALPPPCVDDRQLEMIVRIATTQGVRGLVFLSNQSLAEKDAAPRRRATHLELINSRLQLVEPWLAGGKIVGRVASSDNTRSAMLMHVDYARLLVPVQPEKSDATSAAAVNAALAGKTFIVPGVPESCEAFRLSPIEIRALPGQRVAGGKRIVWEGDDDAFILLTEDPKVISGFRQHVARNALRYVRLERDLAASHAAAAAETIRSLAPLGIKTEDAARAVAAVDTQLRQIDPLLTAGRVPEAHRLADAVRRAMLDAADQQRRTIGVPTEIGIYPLALSYDQLAAHAQFVRRMEGLRGGDNLLFGGDFEDIVLLTGVGWQHVRHPLPGIEARAELSSFAPMHGSHCLELHAGPTAANAAPATLSSAPVWITSPPMHVEKGQIVEITGWVRVAEPIMASIDGLQIVDSLGGAELSLSIDQTSGWQPFQIVRAVPEATDLRLTFALTGLGTAYVDGVMVRTLQQPIARRLPPVETNSTADRRALGGR